jgi:hypothetical protein
LESRILTKVFRGSNFRRSRLHDEKDNWAIRSASDLGDAGFALLTAILRVSTGYRPAIPFIALNAFRFLKKRLPANARVFEWSSGMSTLWYERNCAEVHAVEDDADWFKVISSRTKRARVYNLEGQDYVNKIREFPVGYFDLISIDGSDRLACFEVAQEYLRPGGMLLVDNTDKDRASKGDLYQIDCRLAENAQYKVYRFTGWTHGNFFPQETTIGVSHTSGDSRLSKQR